jgi:hypothetical protein
VIDQATAIARIEQSHHKGSFVDNANPESNLRAALGALIAVTLATIALVLFTDGDKKTVHDDHVPAIAQAQR